MSSTVVHAPGLPKPPTELMAFVERQVRDARLYSGVERRSESRVFTVLPVCAQPLDADLVAVGDVMALVAGDISPTGIGLVHLNKIENSFLALQLVLADEQVHVLANVRWCKPRGPFYSIGCEFIRKLNRFPLSPQEAPTGSGILAPHYSQVR